MLFSRSGKTGKLLGDFPELALPLYGTSVSGAVFGVYVEDPELPLDYRGGPEEMLNSDLLKSRKREKICDFFF